MTDRLRVTVLVVAAIAASTGVLVGWWIYSAVV